MCGCIFFLKRDKEREFAHCGCFVSSLTRMGIKISDGQQKQAYCKEKAARYQE